MLESFPTLTSIIESLDSFLRETHPDFFGKDAKHPFAKLRGYKVIHDHLWGNSSLFMARTGPNGQPNSSAPPKDPSNRSRLLCLSLGTSQSLRAFARSLDGRFESLGFIGSEFGKSTTRDTGRGTPRIGSQAHARAASPRTSPRGFAPRHGTQSIQPRVGEGVFRSVASQKGERRTDRAVWQEERSGPKYCCFALRSLRRSNSFLKEANRGWINLN